MNEESARQRVELLWEEVRCAHYAIPLRLKLVSPDAGNWYLATYLSEQLVNLYNKLSHNRFTVKKEKQADLVSTQIRT